MTKTVTILGTVVAVIVGVATLSMQAPLELVTLCVVATYLALFASLRWTLPRSFLLEPVAAIPRGFIVLGAPVTAACLYGAQYAVSHLVTDADTLSFMLVATAISPVILVAYQYDRWNHKTCPDCCETIKRNAQICRHVATSSPRRHRFYLDE